MKPRRWYSSPEVVPATEPHCRPVLPDRIYWTFMSCTCPDQGPIIKTAPPETEAGQQRRGAPARARPLRLIDAA
jgi:hypothetical protein